MRAWEIRGGFGLDNLTPTDRPDPEPGAGELLLDMRAASLNYRDLMTVRGQYNPRQPLPLVPCSDGVGVVRATGDGVTRFAVGDRVIPIFAQRWLGGDATPERIRSTLGGPLDGTLAESMVVHEDGAVAAPEHLTDAEAATLPCAALTAWSSLVTHGGLTAGQTVLILGTGGVSIFALQFARLLGATTVITSSSDAKLERARELGATHTINYRTDTSWGKTARALTGGQGVDVVVEAGGAGTLTQSVSAVRPGGTVALFGVLSGASAEVNVVPILMNQARIQGIFVGHRDGFEAMNRAIATHGLRPVVDAVVPFDRAREAFDTMAAATHLGKICVAIGDRAAG